MSLPWKIQEFDELDSTNNWLMQQPSPPRGQAVLALRQTAGRGRLGRKWEAGSGGQLTGSFFIASSQWPHFPPALTLLVGLAVLCALEDLGVEGLSLKWPNDLLWGRRKLAGILCESRPGGMVAGVGVNLKGKAEDYSRELSAKLIHLETLGVQSPGPRELFAQLLAQVDRLLDLCTGGLEPLVELWHSKCGSIGALVSYDDDGEPQVGEVLGLSPQGALRLLGPKGEVRLWSGEVEFVSNPYDAAK